MEKRGALTYICLQLFLVFAISTADSSLQSDQSCMYTVYVKTGSIQFAGSDCIMSLTIFDAKGSGVEIKNLEAWGGLMGKGYDYFEFGNLDIFSGTGPCLNGPICSMKLASNGIALFDLPAWYCEYVEVTATGDQKACSKQKFQVNQWLSFIFPPFSLVAERNNCVKASNATNVIDGGRKIMKEAASYVLDVAV